MYNEYHIIDTLCLRMLMDQAYGNFGVEGRRPFELY